MGELRVAPYTGRDKWGEVAVHAGVVVVGTALAAGVLLGEPGRNGAMRVLGWYTLAGVLLTLVMVVLVAGTRRLPTLAPAQLDGRPALAVRAWPVAWWYDQLLDLGLTALGGWLALLALRAGGDLVVPGLLLVLPTAWLLVRLLLTLVGRRRNQALWLTDDEVVHDSPWGRERCPRTSVVRVLGLTGTPYLVLDVAGVDRRRCPRPWRTGRRPWGPEEMFLDCSLVGHDAGDLADWLRLELVPGTGGVRSQPVGPGRATSRTFQAGPDLEG